jgi:Platelet-activating factor acetylhydrolase, isoform II
MRNTSAKICCELASRGFVVAAIEHADGTACCTELATGVCIIATVWCAHTRSANCVRLLYVTDRCRQVQPEPQ